MIPKETVSFFFGYHILFFALSENTEKQIGPNYYCYYVYTFSYLPAADKCFTECYCVTQSHNFHFKVAAFTAKSTTATPTATTATLAAPLALVIRAP